MDENWRSLFSHYATNDLIVHSEPIGKRKMWNTKKCEWTIALQNIFISLDVSNGKRQKQQKKKSKRDRFNVFTITKNK